MRKEDIHANMERIRASMERARSCAIGMIGEIRNELERDIADGRRLDIVTSLIVQNVANMLVHIDDADACATGVDMELTP